MSDPHSKQAHYRQGTDLLWNKEKLDVYFMNAVNHPEEISCETIIEWMNEWRGGRGGKDNASSVPKFVRSEDPNPNHNDIRVEFDGMYTSVYICIIEPSYRLARAL